MSKPQNELNSDEIFEIDIKVEDVSQLGGYEFDLIYDPGCIQVLSVEKGELLLSTNRNLFPLESVIDNESGNVKYAVTTLGSEINGASGSGTLIKMECKALQPDCEMPVLNKVQLVQIDGGVIDYKIKAKEVDEEAIGETYILKNYPIPFTEEMTIQYRVGKEGSIEFKVYDISGKLIKITESRNRSVGEYTETFNREGLNAGLYFYLLELNNEVLDTRIILIK